MLISNARWLTPEGYFEEGNMRIANGRIVRFGADLKPEENEEVLDTRGYLILPGMIDPHVHFREPGQVYKEGIRNGSKAALKGGVTTVLDMPNNRPPITTLKRLQDKRQRFARKSLVNWGVLFHATKGPVEIDDLAKSVKIFMARSSSLTSITNETLLTRLFEWYDRVSIHAEDESQFPVNPAEDLPHHERRPRKAIVSALQKIERSLKRLEPAKRPTVILCHANTAEEMQWARRMKNEGFDLFVETAPHYLFFTQEKVQQAWPWLKVNPPIRTAQDQDALKQGLAENLIDFIGTDHAPHTQNEKRSAAPPSGIAGIEWVLPLMLNLIDQNLITWKQLHRLICAGAAKAYGIEHRDGIKEGNRADLVFVKRTTQATMNKKIVTKAGVNVYEHVGCCWHVEQTMVNGIVKYRKGKFINEEPGRAV